MPWTKLIADMSSAFTGNLNGENGRILSYQQAISEAIDQAMSIDKNVIVMGEGVDTAGYIYETTTALSSRYGRERVFETPIAEATTTGMALGASIAGLRPILIHMRNDFLLVSMDQIVNHISHWQKVFGGKTSLVIRAIVARGWGSGAQHSQSFHSLFAGLDGLTVIMPATPYDVKGLFLSSIASGKPVLFLEHRWLYGDKGVVPQEPYTIPLGKGALRSEGNDLTIVAMSLSNRDVASALKDVSSENITADWIDLRSINPLDLDLICNSVKKTGRLLVVENGPLRCGIGAEIAASVSVSCWNSLKCPVQRIGWPGSTVPSGCKLEEGFYPSAEDIKNTIKRMVHRIAE